MDRSVQFFDAQFGKQVAANDFQLNPFEQRALPHLAGEVLDFGCGLGNLSLAAARQGCRVVALDAAPTAVVHLAAQAREHALPIEARQADLRHYAIERDFDTVVAIGLLMFFDRASAWRQLGNLMARTRSGGVAVVNVLVEGTTYLDMFDPAGYHLFDPELLRRAFGGWEILSDAIDEFPAPGATCKRFVTLIARKP